MIELLLIFLAIYVLAKISGPSVWKGWSPPRHRKTIYRRGEKPHGLPWMGGRVEQRKRKYYWDD